MSKNVSREKYEKAKEAVHVWHKKYQDADVLIKELKAQISTLEKESERWRKLSEELPDNDMLEELENENKTFRREVRGLKKDRVELTEKYRSTIAKLEREKLLSDGRIQQLEEAKKDLKERYTDLKQDYRELQRHYSGMARGSVSRAE